MFALGIMPYITASIIMQLLAVVIPKLQALARGRRDRAQGHYPVDPLPDGGSRVCSRQPDSPSSSTSGNFTGGLDLIP